MTEAAVDLDAALVEADLRVLLMVLVHLTGDPAWMAPPFRPKRDVKLIADEEAGLDSAAVAEIRAAAAQVLDVPEPVPAIDDPGDALMVTMMRACLGERVPPEYAPMMREEMGFRPRQVTWSAGAPPAAIQGRDPVVIVGAGASGIALGANLERLGLPYLIIEAALAPGGTWHQNRYPGCGVDTPNHAYSFSFARPYPWSRYFALRDELHDYLMGAADEAGIIPKIRFETRVTGAVWDEAAMRWRVSVTGPEGSETLVAPALVSAVGQLSLPSVPRFPGDQDFSGPLFHSAHWPDDLAIDGKRVAVIGTGASAMQIVPAIADRTRSLTVFQRSPQWVRPIPRYNQPISPGQQWLLQHVPYYAAWFRFTMAWRYGDGLLPFLRKDPDWPHPERSLNRVNERHRVEMAEFIRSELAGRQDLVAKCMPDYPPYGKRILLDNGWYRTLRKPGVRLVGEAIERIAPGGLVTADGEHHPADVIVLATGFKVGQMAARLNLAGRGGRSLAEQWAGDDPRAYLGITVPGFPNLFCMQGPNTGLAHGGSAIFQSECQARYIAGCLVAMAERGIAAIEVKQQIHDDYVRRVDAEHEKLVWTHPGMRTYYRNARGRVFSVSPWRLVDYWAMTQAPNPDDNLDDYALTTSM